MSEGRDQTMMLYWMRMRYLARMDDYRTAYHEIPGKPGGWWYHAADYPCRDCAEDTALASLNPS